MTRSLAARAPAKINLTLRVGPLRSDGFHPVESLAAQIGLFDELRVAPADSGLCLTCDSPVVAADESNLVLRAAKLLVAHVGAAQGANFTLHKRIPAGAGLGGGSSDAAATLRLLVDFWKLPIAPSELMALAAQLGSDVPLFLVDSPAWLRGRGELAEGCAWRIRGAAVLILPPFGCPTGAVYAAFDALPPPPDRPSAMELERRIGTFAEPGATPDCVFEVRASLLKELCFNDLLPAALRVQPRLEELVVRAGLAIDAPVHLTGSGAGLFVLVDDTSQAEAMSRRLRAALPADVRVEIAEILS